MAKAEYGLQMYSVRDLTKESMRQALEQVAKAGYKYIEFAGFFDHSAEEIKKMLDEFGLTCSGTHTGIDAIKAENIEKTIEYHKAIGCENLIVPGCDWGSDEKADENIATLNEAQKILAQNGIRLGYHNHSGEFFTTDYGIIIEDEIIARTSVELEIDTFWLFNAGIEPINYLEEHKDRIRVIHLKDGIPSPAENKNFRDVHADVKGLSLGLGEAPVKAVREWAIKNNVLMVVESEGLEPTGIEEVTRCIDYLRTLD